MRQKNAFFLIQLVTGSVTKCNLLRLLAVAGSLWACSGGNGADVSDTSMRASDSEVGDTATWSMETASDIEPDAGAKAACLGGVTGKVLENGISPMVAVVVICIGPRCMTPAVSEADGSFRFEMPLDAGEPCEQIDFLINPLHFEITALDSPEAYARYAFLRSPDQGEISDRGEADYDLDLGTLSLYTLPNTGATYEPDTGLSASLEGVQLGLSPGGIVKHVDDEDVPIAHPQDISVFKAPLDTWDPPFSEVDLSALYFISPRWAKTAGGGLPLSIEAPDGFQEGDEARFFLLGGYISEFGDASVRDRADFIYRNDEGACVNPPFSGTAGWTEIPDGKFADCGTVRALNGRILTPPIPRFTWIGIGPPRLSR